MKKFVFGVLLCFVLFTFPVLSSTHSTEDDKPKITSIGELI
ncbi:MULTISPECIES: hypothetical protein [Psychrobacillus]